MGERKVFNKYYPPDFDPSLIPKGLRPRKAQIKVRMMLPMSIRCTTCGEFIYGGKKFNSTKEDVQGEEYLGIKIYRFYIKCTNCAGEISIITDPENSDYKVESGATRNFEPWRQRKQQEENDNLDKVTEEEDAMKALENKTLEAQREMDILDALDELHALNSRQSKLGTDEVLEITKRKRQLEQTKQEEEELKEDELFKDVVFKNSEKYVKRIDENEEEKRKKKLAAEPPAVIVEPKGKKRKVLFGKVIKVNKKRAEKKEEEKKEEKKIVEKVIKSKDNDGGNDSDDSSSSSSGAPGMGGLVAY